MSLLEVSGLTVRFGGVVAVDRVNLALASGEILGLIGPNGSGKTSLLDAISGFEPYTGSITLRGEPLDGVPAHRRARRGIARTFQGLELFDDLTVDENVRMGRATAEGADGLPPDALLATLDSAQRRLVALTRALADDPSVVLLDEIGAGLDAAAARDVTQRIRAAAQRGAGVVLVDHDIDLVLGVADRVVVLHHGGVLFDGLPRHVRTNATVIAAYLGSQP